MDILATIGIPLAIFYLGTIEKRISDMKIKLDAAATYADVQNLITLNRRDQDVEFVNIKSDIIEVKQLLEKILDKIP